MAHPIKSGLPGLRDERDRLADLERKLQAAINDFAEATESIHKTGMALVRRVTALEERVEALSPKVARSSGGAE